MAAGSQENDGKLWELAFRSQQMLEFRGICWLEWQIIHASIQS
jgi:hypothetical protein